MSRRDYWRSLQERARLLESGAAPEPGEGRGDEFPEGLAEWSDPISRRRFLSLMGASLALAGVTGCTRQPKESIAPFVKQPEQMIPGRPLYYATALTLDGYATGALVETHEGRPTKVEGNPQHPASLGASDVFMQASVLGLYDPDRSRAVTYLGEIRPWGDLLEVLKGILDIKKGNEGAGLRLLTGTVTSPTLADSIRKILARFPRARWHQWEPAGRDNARAGARLAFGAPLETRYRLDLADVILSLDADFLSPGPGSPRYIREFSSRRNAGAEGGAMNRLYVAESFPSLAGSMGDHRLALASGDIEGLARAVAAQLGLPVSPTAGPSAARLAARADWIDPMVRDLERAGPRALVLAGDAQPPVVHALAHAINEALGAAGTTAVYTDPVEAEPADQLASIRDLCAGMDAGEVDILMILGGNPAYSAPADLRFAESMQKVGLRIHLGLYDDETSALCHWHVPEAHELEAWGDARAFDGTVTIQQPMIEPLYGGRTACDLTAAVLELSGRSTYDLLRDYWKGRSGLDGAPFESFWRAALHEGTVPGTGLAGRPASVRRDWMARPTEGGDLPEDGLELVFRPDASVHDGRFANIGWLQELPRPATRLAWDNAALMSPATAARLGLHNEETIELSHPLGSAAVVAPVWILPGHADDSITVHLGYGRTRSGRAGDGTGFDAYPLRSSRALWFARGLQVEATGRRLPLACTQQHQSLEGRNHVRAATLDEFHARPEFAQQMAHEPGPGETLYPPHPYEGHAWGMTIDLNRCVGCNACVVGCQSENNIPVVGREQVIAGREMHWIRVDRYFEGSAEDPHIWHQPVPCMHCENAPCEPVCPVGATVHSSEGLNDMVYNRCVGTRYCSNNCPYKVRRFNFLLYTDWTTPSLKLLNNPDVTVRSRGVMEKCTYCVQRINEARNTAHVAGRTIRDGEVTPACAQACPAEAIVFGDINDPESRVAKLKAGPRSYGMLSELNTRPRTTYLAALRNPNPEMPGSHALLPDAPAHADIGIRPGAAGAAGKEEI